MRARLPSSSAKRREKELEARAARSRATQQKQTQLEVQYLNGPSLGRSSTRIAVFEDGVWRFQPAVGEEYQVELSLEPCYEAPEQSRRRQDLCVWSPTRAATEGINVQAYLAAVAKLYTVCKCSASLSCIVIMEAVTGVVMEKGGGGDGDGKMMRRRSRSQNLQTRTQQHFC